MSFNDGTITPTDVNPFPESDLPDRRPWTRDTDADAGPPPPVADSNSDKTQAPTLPCRPGRDPLAAGRSAL